MIRRLESTLTIGESENNGRKLEYVVYIRVAVAPAVTNYHGCAKRVR